YPGFLRKTNRLFLILHHAVGAGVNLVAMARDQFLERSHISLLRAPHQCTFIGGGKVFFTHLFDGQKPPIIQPQSWFQSFPLVVGRRPKMRGSCWHATSTALAKALKSASTT